MNNAKRKGLEIINLYDEKDEPTYSMTKKKKIIIKNYLNIKNDLHFIAGHFLLYLFINNYFLYPTLKSFME